MSLKVSVSVFNVLCLALFLGGCGSQLNDGGHVTAPETAYQKPGADIQLITPKVAIRAVGKSISFDLGLRVGHVEGMLLARLGSSEGIEVLGEKDIRRVLGAKPVIILPIALYALAEGRHYLPINVIIELPNGQRLHRAVSVVVQVGRPNSQGEKADKAEAAKDQDGRPIKVLPATEAIH